LTLFRDADWFSRSAYFVSACHREVCDSERLIMINLCWQLYLLTATSASHKLNILKSRNGQSQLKIEKSEKKLFSLLQILHAFTIICDIRFILIRVAWNLGNSQAQQWFCNCCRRIKKDLCERDVPSLEMCIMDAVIESKLINSGDSQAQQWFCNCCRRIKKADIWSGSSLVRSMWISSA